MAETISDREAAERLGRRVSQVSVTRSLLGAIDALEKRGHPVKAVHISPTGGLTVLTETPDGLVPSPDLSEGDWVSLAGEAAVSRA